MEKTFSPLSRQFSAIEGLQNAYTLVYSLDADSAGCRLTLCRTGENARVESLRVPSAPEYGYRLLQYLFENVIQPEIGRDVLAELCPAAETGRKGGVVCES